MSALTMATRCGMCSVAHLSHCPSYLACSCRYYVRFPSNLFAEAREGISDVLLSPRGALMFTVYMGRQGGLVPLERLAPGTFTVSALHSATDRSPACHNDNVAVCPKQCLASWQWQNGEMGRVKNEDHP